MKSQRAMWLDGSPNQNPTNTTRLNKNVVITDKLGSHTNEPGLSVYCTNYTGKSPINVIELFNNDFVIFSVTDDNSSEIGYISAGGDYKTIIKDANFNFSLDYPIDGTAQMNSNLERIIAWVDGHNVNRMLNIDNFFKSPFDVKSTELFNTYTLPCVTVYKQNTGGSLVAGKYFPIIQYVREDGSTTSWYYGFSSQTIGAEYFGGVKSGTITSKALRLDINNVDYKYSKINVGYVAVIDNIRTAWMTNSISINRNNSAYVTFITGNEAKTSIELDEVFIEKPVYKTARHIEQLHDSLYIADLREYVEPNQQKYVNALVAKWTSTLYGVSSETDNPYANVNFPEAGLAHGEVYALYIQFYFSWGWGRWYHIPGRTDNPADMALVSSLYDVPYRAYKIRDTVSVSSFGTSTNGGVTTGNMGYWRNEEESYPSNSDFPAGFVRHHRLPTLKWCAENIYNSNADYGITKLDTLGLKIEGINLANIKDADCNQALGFRVGYAKRDLANSLVVGNSGIIFGTYIEMDTSVSPSTGISLGGNWTVPTGTTYVPNINHIRTYPFEALRQKPSVTVTHLVMNYKIRKNLPDHSASIAYKGGDVGTSDTHILIDYTNNTFGSRINTPTVTTVSIKRNLYVPNHIKYDKYDNIFTEEFLALQTGRLNELATYPMLYPTFSDIGSNSNGNPQFEEMPMATLIALKSNCYRNFTDQSIVLLNQKCITDATFTGGDSYAYPITVHTYGRTRFQTSFKDTVSWSADNANGRKDGIRAVRRYITEGQYNVFMRHFNGTNTTAFYPKTQFFTGDLTYSYLRNYDKDVNPNDWVNSYDTSFNALNEYGIANIWKGDKISNGAEPFLIARSQTFNRNSLTNNWHDFKINDTYQLSKNRGRVINIAAGNDYLYIHHERALFITRGREQLTTSGQNVYLGYGDIFEFDPKEIVHDTDGYLGTRHKFSCLITPFGYTFYDDDKGKWYIVSGGSPKTISDNGMARKFFKMKGLYGDNPYNNSNSVQSWYDEEFDRLMVTYNTVKLREEFMKKFKGTYNNTPEFVATLQNGDIVEFNGKLKIITL